MFIIIIINLDNFALFSTLANHCVIFPHLKHLLDILNRVLFIRFLLLISIFAFSQMVQPGNSLWIRDDEATVA